jgi:hypothetical protein
MVSDTLGCPEPRMPMESRMGNKQITKLEILARVIPRGLGNSVREETKVCQRVLS